MNIVVIDLGISNLSSLCNCLNFLGAKFQISNNKNKLVIYYQSKAFGLFNSIYYNLN